MKCAQVQKRLSALVLGLLPAAEAREVAAHGEECEACREELARMRAAARALASARPEVPAVDLTERVLRRITRPAPAPRWNVWVPLAAGAALAAAILAAPWVSKPEPFSTPEMLQAYNEDAIALSLWGTAATTETEDPTWGLPTELAAWINTD